MAIELIEGFDLVGSNADLLAGGWSYAEGSVGVGGGRFGGNSCILGGSSATTLSREFAFAEYICLSFWFKQASAILSLGEIVNIGDTADSSHSSANISIGIGLNYSGSITLDGDGGATIGTSAPSVILPQTWHHIELRGHLSGTGSGSIVVDGVEVINVPSADFLEGTSRNFLMFTGGGATHTLDDIVYQQDASALPPLLGEHKIHTLFPSADTAQADWTGAYTDIDDPIGSTDGDTTYISATTLNANSEFDLGNLAESPTTIHAVQSSITARKTDAGTIGVTQYVDSNGAEGAGTEFAAAETYATHKDVHELNPDGSVAWTETSINALKVGVEITT